MEAMGDDVDPVEVAVASKVGAGVETNEGAVLEVGSGVVFGGSSIQPEGLGAVFAGANSSP